MLCRGEFHTPSDEHVVLNGLGGKLSRSWMTCGGCNVTCGSGIDDTFLKAVQWVTTLVNPKGRRRPPAALRKMTTDKGDVMRIEPGGKIRVEHRRLPDGRWIGDADQAERLTECAEAAARAFEDRRGEPVAVVTEHGQTFNPTFNFNILLDGHVAFRSAVKSALEALSVCVANGRLVSDESLDTWRHYVLHGSLTFLPQVGYLVDPVLPDVLTRLEHSVLLLQRIDGSVYFEVSTYGGIVSVAGVLSPITRRFFPWLYRVDPVTGAASISHPRVAMPANENWTVDPGLKHRARMTLAMERVVELWQRRGDAANMDRIFSECWSDVMTEPGKVITEQHVRALSEKIAARFVNFLSDTKRLG